MEATELIRSSTLARLRLRSFDYFEGVEKVLCECSQMIAGGNTCTDPALGPQLVNADKLPPYFLLTADDGDSGASDENTVHGPADVGLPPYKPIPAVEQADLDNCAKVTASPNFDATSRRGSSASIWTCPATARGW